MPYLNSVAFAVKAITSLPPKYLLKERDLNNETTKDTIRRISGKLNDNAEERKTKYFPQSERERFAPTNFFVAGCKHAHVKTNVRC